MQSVTTKELDGLLVSEGFMKDRHPILHSFREGESVHWSGPISGWVVTHYDYMVNTSGTLAIIQTRGSAQKWGSICPLNPGLISNGCACSRSWIIG
jgi:hypothetical protein